MIEDNKRMDEFSRSMPVSAIVARILAPRLRLSLEDVPAHWTTATIAATLPGYGALADDLVVANRIRGALGRQLMAGASPEAIAGRPCSWNPPCALDLLFREQARLGKHGIPKPWVLALERRRLDLVVCITLFGFAMEWAGAVAQALCVALNGHIDWHARARELFLPKPCVQHLTIAPTRSLGWPRSRGSAVLDFITPFDCGGDDPLDRPATVVGRLARRIDLLARWMDIEVAADWPVLARHWNALTYDPAELNRIVLPRVTGRNKQRFKHELVRGPLAVTGDLSQIWPLLVLGQICHVGRAATAGLGRYVLR
jgi:hypothetical protein